MKYLIIGAGGTGGVTGYYMKKSRQGCNSDRPRRTPENNPGTGPYLRKNVGQNRRNDHHPGCRHGTLHRPSRRNFCLRKKAIPWMKPFHLSNRLQRKTTIVIPVLNIYGTGGKMQKQLPELLVTDGCIYVSANIKEPGRLLQHGQILRIVFGVRDKAESRPELKEIQKDLCDSNIDGILSENIRREALEKFSYVSPIGAAGLYYHATAADFQKEGEARELFKAMIREIAALAEAMGVPFQKDMVDVNLKNSLQPCTGSNYLYAEGHHGRKTV